MDFPSVIVFIAWLLGGFVSGLTGIGGAMLAVPLAAMFIPMHDVILLSCILNLAMDGTLTCMYLRHCRFSALAPLLAGAIPGAFIGLVILQAVSGRILQGGVGLLLLSYVCWQFFARRSGRERSSWAVGSIAGLGAGVLGTAISFDGPPAGAYALWCGWEPRQALGTLGVFFVRFRPGRGCILSRYLPMRRTDFPPVCSAFSALSPWSDACGVKFSVGS